MAFYDCRTGLLPSLFKDYLNRQTGIMKKEINDNQQKFLTGTEF